MSRILPRLRTALDFLPSPDAKRPGLIIRDPFRYSDAVLCLPPALAAALPYLDGQHTELDLQELLTRATGQLVFSTEIHKFVGMLGEHGFLETEEFWRLRDQREAEFRAAAQRQAIHAGTAYPATGPEVGAAFEQYFEGSTSPDGLQPGVLGIAAPHVSPEGGRHCYAAAYRRLAAHPSLAERTLVVLGTSHFGPPEKFGLTRKPFVTPLGTLRVDTALVDWLAQRAGAAVVEEDYCHAIEHSIEFQCVFLQYALRLQHALRAEVTPEPRDELRILPILCGPFADSLSTGRPPETNEAVARFFDALGEMAEQHAGRLFWVLGIDLAHVGRRYGDPFQALANRGEMAAVAEQDQGRLDMVCAGDSGGFLDLVSPGGDKLKWCGYSPLYTFLRAVPRARGRLLRYEQWNIDPQSVVSFAGLEFFPG